VTKKKRKEITGQKKRKKPTNKQTKKTNNSLNCHPRVWIFVERKEIFKTLSSAVVDVDHVHPSLKS
jgi:hypothetical protein